MNYTKKNIQRHYERVWSVSGNPRHWYKGPIQKLNSDFCVLEFPPSAKRKMWAYATCCMSSTDEENPIELHIFSAEQDSTLVELLTVAGFYHYNDSKLNLHHTINFGRPWRKDSKCDCGFISLPYMDGPDLENGEIEGFENIVKFYWLIPITNEELEFKKNRGVEELERKFESTGFDYLNSKRKSVV